MPHRSLRYTLPALAVGLAALSLAGRAGSTPTPDPPASSAWLALLPEGETKRRFILDCTGCHQLDERIALSQGRARTEEEWRVAVGRMLQMAGPASSFPVISAHREAGATAAWLAAHLSRPPTPTAATAAGRADIREFPIPEPRDLPHDVAVDRDGRLVVTGMFTDRMYHLDPATGVFATVPIPVARANPRALEIDAAGDWWVLLGAANQIARYRPATGEWTSFPIGTYAHESRVDSAGRVWFNGHFSRDPEQIGYLDAATGAVRTFTVPTHPDAARSGPMPYGLRVAPDGSVWGTELHGNRVFRFEPRTERFEIFDMPEAHSGPRRPAFDAAGNLWIPEYAGNRLTRFDPRTRRFTAYPLPIADALPYVVEVDPRSGRVWVGTGAADAVLSFDPAAERFTVYPLPSRGAMIRHLAVDARNGEVWAAYGASPGIPSRVARIRPVK